MKIRFLTLLFGLVALQATAQTGLHIGVYGMPQNTWIFNQQDTETSRSNFQYKATWGYAGMVKIGFNFADPIGIHLGAIYSIQGQKHTSDDSLGVSVLTHRDLTYIKIPLLLHINSDPGKVMLNLEFGPEIGFLQEARVLQDEVPVNLPFEPVQLYKPKDIGIMWAIGAEFLLTEWLSFVLVHRGDYGIFDMEEKSFTFNGQAFYDAERLKANNGTFGIMGGFNFCINPQGGSRRTQFWFR